jgi:hypothetical protein
MSGRDILYCAKKTLDLEAIRVCAESIGFQAYHSLTTYPQLVVEFPDTSIAWWWPKETSSMRAYLEDWQVDRIESLNCSSFIEITCHKSSFLELIKLLSALLERYGGYVTCDDKVEILFDAQNIHEFDCL